MTQPPIPPQNQAAQQAAQQAKQALQTGATHAKAAFNTFQQTLTKAERAAFWKVQPNAQGLRMWLLFAFGLILTPIPLLGAMLGFRRAFKRILEPQHIAPSLAPLDRASRYGLIVGAVAGFLLTGFAYWFFLTGQGQESGFYRRGPMGMIQTLFAPLPTYWAVTLPISLLLIGWFYFWLQREATRIREAGRYGSARFASSREIEEFVAPTWLQGSGFFMGLHGPSSLYYAKQGNFLTVAGPRSGKGTSAIIPNLLQDSLQCSWVVVDPKGENAIITASQLKNLGKDVVLLNPWRLLDEDFAAQGFRQFASFNPLALLDLSTPLTLVDDVDILAEMIVPIPAGGVDKDHFTIRARAYVAGMILHLVTSPPTPDAPHTLRTIWGWFRSPQAEFQNLILAMVKNDHPTAGPVVQAAGDSMGSLMQGSGREFTSIISSAQRYTDFLKSPALEASMSDTDFSFDLRKLTDGNTAIFIIIPADRIKTSAAWLRLVTTALMRTVVRRPNKRVTFLLDESYALGYSSETETLLGLGAGYNLSIWSIFQSMTQIKDLYGDNWENFLGSSAVRQFFGIGDQFSAEYLSAFIGTSTIVDVTATGELKGVSARPVLNPDEVRRGSGRSMFTFIEQRFPVEIPKISYLEIASMLNVAAPNPYHAQRT